MRSLAHEAITQRTSTSPRHETWDLVPSGPTRRAVLRRALRQGWLRAATAARPSAANEQVPADHDRAEREKQPGLPDPAGVATA